ncbi:hypothetical protein ACQKWADRAFT_148396 [Trichoderma austrokoningii]
MAQPAASSSSLPRFLLRLSASSTSSPPQLHDSACQSTGIELVAIRHRSPWSNSTRLIEHKPLPAVEAAPSPSSSASHSEENEQLGLEQRSRSTSTTDLLGLQQRSRGTSTTNLPAKGMTPAERQHEATQVWRSYW